MYTLSIAYNNDSKDFFQATSELLKNDYSQVALSGYNENAFKSRNKAFKLKGGWSARMTPFALITDEEGNPLKAFYSEAEECTIDNIKFYLDTLITALNENEYESSNHQHIN